GAAPRPPRLLEARTDHAAVEAGLGREEFEAEVEVPGLEELLDLDRVHRGGERNRRSVCALVQAQTRVVSAFAKTTRNCVAPKPPAAAGASIWRPLPRSAGRSPPHPRRS